MSKYEIVRHDHKGAGGCDWHVVCHGRIVLDGRCVGLRRKRNRESLAFSKDRGIPIAKKGK